MALTPLASPLYADLFGDPETAALFSPEAEIAALIEVERALAGAQGALGVIPAEAAAALEAALREARVDPAILASGTGSAGVAVPALVAQLRSALPRAAADYLHFGATSQDIVDTGTMLRAGRALALYETRLEALLGLLVHLARTHRATAMAGRTRGQVSTPVSLGLRLANWALPLARARVALAAQRERLPVQLGGASGDLSVLGERGAHVREAVAHRLGLAPSLPWMTDRAPVRALGQICIDLTSALGKIGADVALMTRSEAGEMRLASAGGSSTMPQKQNPVRAETLVALGRFVAGLAGQLAASGFHAEERDGAAWMGEWLVLPQMCVATGSALETARRLVDTLEPQTDAMTARATGDGGLPLAETLSFALLPHVGRAQAQDLVKRAAADTRTRGTPLVEALRALTDAPLDWEALAAPHAATAAAARMTDALLAEIDALAAQ